jgi:hypothetical protein
MATNKLYTGIYIHPSGRQSDYFDAPSEFVRQILYCVLFPSSHRGFPHWCQRPATAEALLHAFIRWPYVYFHIMAIHVHVFFAASCVLIMFRLRLSHYNDVSAPSGSEDIIPASE